jgi:prophage tail gpP-like protein
MSDTSVTLPEIVVTPDTPTDAKPQIKRGEWTPTPGVTQQNDGGATGSETTVRPVVPSLSMNKPEDVATLVVNGMEFDDWETVSIHATHVEQASTFRFTAAERDFPAGALRQFGPGDRCQIWLGNSLVIDGFIEHRQISYDAQNHGVELQGVNFASPVLRSSVDTTTGNFDNMNVQQVAEKVLSAYAGLVGVRVIGALNLLPFVKLQNQPGEQIYDFIERIARPRGIIVGNDSFGNMLLIGPNAAKIDLQLIEGQNIKKCQAIFHKSHSYTEIDTIGQTAADDSQSGTAASEQQGQAPGPGYFPSKLIVQSEQPVWGKPELVDRAKWEALWQASDQFQVFCTVPYWYFAPGQLWWPLDNVYVFSPMVPVDTNMAIQSVTFSQDDRGGTQTEIELRMPWGLNSNVPIGKIGPAAPAVTIPPGQALPPTPL